MKHFKEATRRCLNRKRLSLFVLVTAFAAIKMNAQYDGGIETITYGRLSGHIATQNSNPLVINATAPLSYSLQPQEQSKKIQNIITLSLIEETPEYLNVNFTASVQVKIDYGVSTPDFTETKTLTVTYDKNEGVKYNAKNYFSFEGAGYVNITVIANPVFTPSNIGITYPEDVLLLQNEMRVTRYFELADNVSFSTFTGPTSVTNPVDSILTTWSWPATAGYNYTQLEWTWLEDELRPNYYIPNTTTVDEEKLFLDNATRIDLPSGIGGYSIPLFYDGAGQLFYRIRPVTIKPNGSRSDGAWSAARTCSYEGHNKYMNWQASTSFAEDGKRKSVMTYFDGAPRSRQVVTKDNVNYNTVTAETFYDYEGRPVIQVLPTPGINNIIQYQANLNLFNGQANNQNPADFFDLSPVNGSGSQLYNTTALSTLTGTSKYYSSNNPDANNGINKNIPDAEGFPYTVTRYTPDATGRIMAQSGVGATHKMGSTRETRYYYGTPAQEELDGLFGTEVGNYTHYFKTMVRDANGQMSVSYTDMHGRTIATALAGDSPSNLLALNINDPVHYPNQGGKTITRNLLNRTTNVIKGNSIEAVNTILVPMNGVYTFNYSLSPDKLQLANCNAGQLCYDCLYDLDITITDESGDVPPVSWKFTNVSLNPDDSCGTETPALNYVSGPNHPDSLILAGSNIQILRLLQQGSYYVRKTLSLSESSLQKYKTMFLTAGKGICKTEQEIIDSVYNVLLQTSGCNEISSFTCDSCFNQLGDFEDFKTAYLLSIGNPFPVPPTVDSQIVAAYRAGVEDCNRICNNTSQLLSSKRQMMLADMMPYGGQYASDTLLPPLVPGSGTTMYDKYNIFQGLLTGRPYYKYPWNTNQQLDFYRDENNEIDQIIHPGGSGYTTLNGLSKDQFTGQFVNSWANALLPHHPEYSRLVYAEGNLNSSYNWISHFTTTNTYANATDSGYIMTNSATITDPFYSVAPASYKTDMATWISSNYGGSNFSLWQVARGNVKCINITDPVARQTCYANGGVTVPPFSGLTTDEKNRMWVNFRNMYAAARDNQVNTFIAAQVPLSDAADLINQGYQLRFGTNSQTATQYGWGWFPPGGGASGNPPVFPPGGTPDSIYTERCSGYIEQWKRWLLQCGTLAGLDSTLRNQVLTEITNGMVSVCVRGSDDANPYGSSTVAVHTNGLPDSFEEVINQVYQAHGINPPKDYYCNPYVIEFPKPHGKNPVFVLQYTSIIDSCACSQFDSLKIRVAGAGGNPNSFSSINAYLLSQHLDTLTLPLYNVLLNCNSYFAIVCDTLYEDKIVSCYDPAPCTYTCAPRPAAKNKGLSPDSPVPDFVPTSCQDFQYIIACFFDFYEGGPLPATYPNCQQNFTDFFNSWAPLTSYSWHDIDSIHQVLCGGPLNVCFNCTDTVSCPTGTVTCDTVFAPYFLPEPLPIPEYLKCGGWPPKNKCLVCDSLVALTAEFKTIFSPPYNTGPIFNSTNLTPVQIQQNILYAQFLNFRTGMQYSWTQYAEAAAGANCNPDTTGGGGGIADLVVTIRNNNTPQQYIASNSITFDPNFDHPVGDDYETLLQPNGGGAGGQQVVICPDPYPLNDTTGLIVLDSACHRTRLMAIEIGQEIYQQQLLAVQAGFVKQYKAKCLSAINSEAFTVQYFNKEYHYTLYYFDNSGGLVKTVPPKGVHPDYDNSFLTAVAASRDACSGDENSPCTPLAPPHTFTTNYRYNGIGGVVAQNSPDANTSKFWYDRLGRLVVSQNAQQAVPLSGGATKYSYTLYDALGRIVEVGQKPHATPMTQTISQDDVALNDWITTQANGGGLREQMTITGYDVAYGTSTSYPNGILYGAGLDQRNLRNRVSFSGTKNFENDVVPPPFIAATYYTYDVHGNVDTLLQDYGGIAGMNDNGQRFKRMVYNYDLISGKVNMVSYQADWYHAVNQQWITNADKFFHKYKYDAENRIIEVLTSRDKINWERDAAYNYYKYGPLARTELGQLKVQGIDYAYTIQGWLKGVNGTRAPISEGAGDIGGDGLVGGANSNVARDVYGYALHYFDDGNANTTQAVMDYKAIGGTTLFARPNNVNFKSLYNGNIGGMSVNNAGLAKGPAGATNALPLFTLYQYDQLNRIRSMDAYTGLQANNTWVPVHTDDYKESVTYDPNGNILKYDRNGTLTTPPPGGGTGGLAMDNLRYMYYYRDINGNKYQYDPTLPAPGNAASFTNQLAAVKDDQANNNAYTADIDNEADNNYTYDAIGNLVADQAEGIDHIAWTVYGKIDSIHKTNGMHIKYTYDATGNRISKKVINPPTGSSNLTVYVRDASGNVMSIYSQVPPAGGGTPGPVEQTELHIYGSSRIGIKNKDSIPAVTNVSMQGGYIGILTTFTRGEKLFELSNHLGNVLVTITDKRIRYLSSIDQYYAAEVVSATDYYPFGMQMPGRKYEQPNGSYRYSINGQEKEKDLNENITTALYWEYDSRIGRRWNVDMVIRAWESSYAVFLNNPVKFGDPSGNDPIGQQYKIQKGDNWWKLENKFKLKHGTLQEWNNGVKVLKVGQLINISDPSKGMLIGASGSVKTGEDSQVGGGNSGIPAQDPTTLEGKRQLEAFKENICYFGYRGLEECATVNYQSANDKATFISNCSTDVGDDVDKAVERFLAKTGGTFTDYSNSEKRFASSSIFSNLKNDIIRSFEESMKQNDGDLTKVTIANKLKAPNLGSLCVSMKALFGGTQQVDVFLADIKISANKTYTATFRGIIWDDYGVSTDDFTVHRNFGAQEGLTGMWILQHQYGYKPLVNGLNFSFITTGTYK